MAKRQANPSNGLESNAPKRTPHSEEGAPSPSPPVLETEAEEAAKRKAHDPSREEEHGVSDALMESYNG
ncbi:MAG: hypothetical protein ACE5JF_06655 [Anaerolineales bacterium]